MSNKHSIDYDEQMISCEPTWTCSEEYFDYHGNALDFSEYDRVFETDGMLGVWKDGKFGLIDFEKNVIIPPIMRNGASFHRKLFERGLVISENEKREGLSTLAGKIIIPHVYSALTPRGDFVIASCTTSMNWCLNNTLFTLDGKAVMSGALRRIQIDTQKNILSVETPTGLEFLKIETAFGNESPSSGSLLFSGLIGCEVH